MMTTMCAKSHFFDRILGRRRLAAQDYLYPLLLRAEPPTQIPSRGMRRLRVREKKRRVTNSIDPSLMRNPGQTSAALQMLDSFPTSRYDSTIIAVGMLPVHPVAPVLRRDGEDVLQQSKVRGDGGAGR